MGQALSFTSKVEEINREDWNNFINHHPHENVFQSPDYYEIMRNIPNYNPFVIVAYMGGSIQGVMAGVIQKEFEGYLGYFTSRSIVMGGPLIYNNDSHILEGILHYYLRHFKRKSLYTQFRNIHNVSWSKEIFKSKGFRYEEHLDILINLTVGVENLRSAMHKSRRRNLTKATNKGVELIEVQTIDQLKSGIGLISETYNRVKLPCPDSSLFVETFKILSPQNKLRVFLAVNDGNVIGIRLALLYNKLVYDWYAGSSFTERNKYPNDFLIYHVLLWGKENGYEVFDFGGAGNPDEEYGVREHKMKFGGELVNYGRFQRIHAPLFYSLISSAYKSWKKLKGAN